MILAAAAVVALSTCSVPNVDAAARCGTVTVAEDPAEPRGRTIALNTIVIPASKRSRNAIFFLQGGPGQAVTALAPFYFRTFAGAHATHDFVFVDQRGTGKSNPLNCDISAGPGLFPPDTVAKCAAEALQHADPRFYTTREAIRDLDEVRDALGYERIDLYGTSYGTRVAIEYARKYPKRIRSAILKGIVAPEMRYTTDSVADTEASLERVRAACHCPLDLSRLSAVRDELGIVIRGMLHSRDSIAKLPKFLAAADDATIRGEFERARGSYAKGLSLGVYFSVTCSEDIWRGGETYWHRQLAAACERWPHAGPHREVAETFETSIPALLVSGVFDPVTPPRWGDAVAKIFPNSANVKIDNASHSFGGMEGCVDLMMSAFVRDPRPKKVDASCTKKIPPIAFE